MDYGRSFVSNVPTVNTHLFFAAAIPPAYQRFMQRHAFMKTDNHSTQQKINSTRQPARRHNNGWRSQEATDAVAKSDQRPAREGHTAFAQQRILIVITFNAAIRHPA